MAELTHTDSKRQELMAKAVAFCWETQHILTEARFMNWAPQRLKMHIKSRTQTWRAFPHTIRTEAHQIFLGEINEQLAKPAEQRDSAKPVWLNENLGIGVVDNSGGSGEPAASSSEIIKATK